MTEFQTQKYFKTVWLATAILLFAYLIFRNAGLHAVVMADEWYYSSFSRLTPFSDVSVPSYLYLLISRSTRSCGDGFLECARLINVLMYIAAALPLYAIGRRFLSPALAAIATLFALAGPINSYTAYFMPEAMYFMGFAVLSLTAFRFSDAPSVARAALIGIAAGAMTLIKVHGLFLLPACLVFVAIFGAMTKQPAQRLTVREILMCLAVMLAATAIVRFGGGFLIAGKNGLSLLGSLYAGQATHSGAQHASLLNLLQLALFNLRGHLFGLALLFGMPIAVLIYSLASLRGRSAWATPQAALFTYTALMLISLLAVTVLFTASVAGSGQESNLRLHMRYYNFCFPLLLFVGASSFGDDRSAVARRWRIVIASLLGATILYAALTLWRPYTPSFVDSPELQGMTAWRQGFYLLSTLAFISVLLWAKRPRSGARVFFFGFMPVFLLIGGYAINREVARGGESNQFDQAGAFVHDYLTPEERTHLAIITDDGSGMFKAQFYADDARIFQHMRPQQSMLDRNALPPTTDWVLFIGKYPVPPGAAVRVQGRRFSLVELSPQSPEQFSVDFSKPDGGMLAQSKGLSGIEPWGRWSDGPIVTLEFAQPLPKHFKLGLLVEAYGANAGQLTTVKVGEAQEHVKIEKAKKMIVLEFATSGNDRSIEIIVPAPTSPHDLNGSEDRRRLGIGFSKLTVDAIQ